MTKAIWGFKIKIEKMEGKAKLSQNHSLERRKLVIQGLDKLGSSNGRKIESYMKNSLENDLIK